MKTAVKIIILTLLVLFIATFFLNCGRANAMSRREKIHRNKIDHIVYSEDHQQLSPRGGNASRVEASYEYVNYLGETLFRYTLIGRWCYDNGRVTCLHWSDPDKHSITGYPWNVWHYNGSQSPENTGGTGMRYAFRRITGSFGVDIAWFHHTETVYVQCTVRGDGTDQCGNG